LPTQQAIELILARQLAYYLATPIFIVDPQGVLLFYNEPAELILGRRFEETGAMPASAWTTIFTPMDAVGAPLPPESLPLVTTLNTRKPAHRDIWITGLDQVKRHIEITSLPLVGIAGRFLGGMALFWEIDT
jgi:PAS domain-containing protein